MNDQAWWTSSSNITSSIIAPTDTANRHCEDEKKKSNMAGGQERWKKHALCVAFLGAIGQEGCDFPYVACVFSLNNLNKRLTKLFGISKLSLKAWNQKVEGIRVLKSQFAWCQMLGATGCGCYYTSAYFQHIKIGPADLLRLPWEWVKLPLLSREEEDEVIWIDMEWCDVSGSIYKQIYNLQFAELCAIVISVVMHWCT